MPISTRKSVSDSVSFPTKQYLGRRSWPVNGPCRRSLCDPFRPLRTSALRHETEVVDCLFLADGSLSTALASLASSTGDGGQARCRKRAACWRRWAVWLPAMVSFAGEAGQLLLRRWAGGWRFATWRCCSGWRPYPVCLTLLSNRFCFGVQLVGV